MGIATATLCGYSGLLAAPALLGFMGEHYGFGFVFLLMAALILCLLVLAPMVGRQDVKQTKASNTNQSQESKRQ
jgi:uncharacterized membrane protein